MNRDTIRKTSGYSALIPFLLFLLVIPRVEPAEAGGSYPGCFVGTFLIEEGNGTMSLWTFDKRGTLIINSSAQKALNFSTEQGAWKKSGTRMASAVALDFSFDENGELLNIARVDATVHYNGNQCGEIEGDFTLRFYESGEDPLDPDSDTGEIISDTFTGRRVSPE